VTGWADTGRLADALAGLCTIGRLIRERWGVEKFKGGQSWNVRTADGGGSVTAGADPLPLDKPADWPPPIPFAWLEQARRNLSEIADVMGRTSAARQVEAAVQSAGPTAPDTAGDGLELVPAGFAFKGQVYDLTGKPRDMLAALLNARHRRCTVEDLRGALDVDDEAVNYPEQVIRDTAKALRQALRRAAKAARLRCTNPLPSKGKGKDLAYILAMP
jgi:hypothetical protein